MPKNQVSKKLKSINQIAERFQVSQGTVRRWTLEGCPKRKIKNRLMLDQDRVEAWLKKKGRLAADKKARQGRPQPEGAPSTAASKARVDYEIERAKLKRLVREEKEGLLHNVETCRNRRLQQIRATRTAFQSLPRSVAIELVGKNAKQIERILGKAIKGIIDQRLVGDLK